MRNQKTLIELMERNISIPCFDAGLKAAGCSILFGSLFGITVGTMIAIVFTLNFFIVVPITIFTLIGGLFFLWKNPVKGLSRRSQNKYIMTNDLFACLLDELDSQETLDHFDNILNYLYPNKHYHFPTHILFNKFNKSIPNEIKNKLIQYGQNQWFIENEHQESKPEEEQRAIKMNITNPSILNF